MIGYNLSYLGGRQDKHTFKASLGYIVSVRQPMWHRNCLSQTKPRRRCTWVVDHFFSMWEGLGSLPSVTNRILCDRSCIVLLSFDIHAWWLPYSQNSSQSSVGPQDSCILTVLVAWPYVLLICSNLISLISDVKSDFNAYVKLSLFFNWQTIIVLMLELKWCFSVCIYWDWVKDNEIFYLKLFIKWKILRQVRVLCFNLFKMKHMWC